MILCIFGPSIQVYAGEVTRVLLAANTPHATPYYVQESAEPGPTVLIVGAIHGNEPAGAHAVDVVRYWPIKRGTIICVPRANVTALAAGKRRIPNVRKEHAELNRAFPRPDAEPSDSPEHPLPKALWQFVTKYKPDWILDCHEGVGFHKVNGNSIGSSIISDGKSDTAPMIERMLEAVNAEIQPSDKKFVMQPGPLVQGSLVRAASDHCGANTLILATSTKDQRIPLRARQHRQMLHAALTQLEMLDSDVTYDSLFTDLCDPDEITVGIFDDAGVGGSGRERIEADLAKRPEFRTIRIDGQDIRTIGCDQFDVLVFSGGIGSTQANSLGEEGCRRVKQFVKEGGTYVGICAGAYLASSGKGYGLGLLNVRTKSSKWMRGRATLTVELSPSGLETFAIEGTTERPILYANGPVWESDGRDDLPEADVLGWYRTETAKNDTPPGIMIGSPALIVGRYGNGHAYAFSCHPEQSENCEEFVFRAIATARELQWIERSE